MKSLQAKFPSHVKQIIQYTLPELYTGKEWYIGFYAFDPLQNKMRRKRIKINFIKGITKRRKYGEDLKKRICQELSQGWNPWIESNNENAYHLFSDVIEHYRIHIAKLMKDGLYREETYTCYSSQCRNMEEWNKSRKIPITYIYQFDRSFCVLFLEEVYIVRDNTPSTRDNYLSFLQSFSRFCLNHNYFKSNPTEGISVLGKRSKKKIRTIIPEHELNRLNCYLNEKNKYFLLACYILYYCFIRPKEMSLIKLSHFSLSKQTIFIPDTISKNRKDGTITLPAKVIHLMLELNIFDSPTDYYLFSDGFRPGSNQRTEKQFRDFWSTYVRKSLKYPNNYKFYSLKDTGITNMLRKYDVLSVRDQARHSSILMTDIYTPHDIEVANDLIKNYDSNF